MQKFIQTNEFQHTDKDLTAKFQKDVRTTVQDRPQMMPKEHKWKFVNLNPFPTSIRGLIKIHSPNKN